MLCRVCPSTFARVSLCPTSVTRIGRQQESSLAYLLDDSDVDRSSRARPIDRL